MSEQNNTSTPMLQEEFLYLVTSRDTDEKNQPTVEIAQYRKGKFWFFGWEVPEPIEKFASWKELIVGIKE
jgi:hypothetical protein